ncbi:MAG: TonB-dependent receptor, partial [Acidobacteriota bacterium]|nr:TonB-dependent receptor [Acidobacteriota bacterium]
NGVRGNPYGSLGGDVNNSGFSVSQLQLSNIERIEILKGPASVLYGSTEPGGVVNYVTAKPQEEFGVRGSVRFGQYGQTYGSAEVTGPLGDSERLLYRFAAYGNERDSFRANASMRNVHLVGNLAWRISDRANLSFEYENIDQDLMGHRLRGVPVEPDGTFVTDITWTATEPTDFTTLDADVFQVRWDQVFARDWTLDATLRYLEYDREQEYHEPRGITPENTMKRHFRDQTRTNDDVSFVLNLNKIVRVGPTVHRLLFGADMFRQDHSFRYGRARDTGAGGPVPNLPLFAPQYGLSGGSDYGLTENDFTTDTAVARQLGFYVQDHLDLGSAFHLVAGGRYNAYDDSGFAGGNDLLSEESGLTGKVGMVFKPETAWSLYGSYSTSFNRPSVLAQTPSANGPHDPETAVQLEIGAKTELLDDLSLTAALFTITKSNVLRPDPDYGPNGNNWNAALQVGEARNRGFEVEFVGSLTRRWQAAVNYTYLDSEIVEDTNADAVGQPLPNAPPHSLGLFSRMELFRDTAAGLGVTYVGDRVEPYAGIEAPAFTVVDLFLYRQLGRFAEVQVKLENAFDTVYATSSLFSARAGNFPGQPRTFSVLVSFGGLR